MTVEAIRLYGAPNGVPGVQVREKVGTPPQSPLLYGTTAFIGGVLKRGPMGVPLPIFSRGQYDNVFGKPGEATWHLYPDALEKGFPDAIDGYFAASNSTGPLWLVRNELDGTGKKASQIFYARSDASKPVLQITAANEGRWGGYRQDTIEAKVLGFSANTFIINRPDTGTNELEGATVSYINSDDSTSEQYIIQSNSASDIEGNVECVVSQDIPLETIMVTESFTTTVQITGTVDYQRNVPATGLASYDRYTSITGTVKARRHRAVITGDGTAFRTDLSVGQHIYIGGVRRKVKLILSDTKLVVNRPFNIPTANYTLDVDNFTITGETGVSDWTNVLRAGDYIRWFYASTNEWLERRVRTVVSDTEIVLYDTLPESFTNDTIQYVNQWLEGTGTDFATDVTVGDIVTDSGSRTVIVEEIDTAASPERFRISVSLEEDIINQNVSIHPVTAVIDLNPALNNGLSITIGNGALYPETHFSIEVFFENTSVFRVGDASLDPNDQFYIEQAINDANIAYESDGAKYYAWIEATSLLQGEYFTEEGKDVRPGNASATVVVVDTDNDRLLYFSETDDNYYGGSPTLLLNPYTDPRRATLSTQNLTKVKTLTGTYSAVATAVTGVGTTFLTDYVIGDYLYDPATGEAREIIGITDDLNLTVIEAFTSDPAVGTMLYKLGIINLAAFILSDASVGDDFLLIYQTDLEGGYDGDVDNVPASYITRYFDPTTNLLEKAALGLNHGLIRMAVPGITDPLVQQEGIKYAAARAYEFRVEIPPTVQDAIGAESYVLRTIGRSDFMTVSFPSYATISDPRDGKPRLISITGDIMGLETFKASVSAGYQNLAAGMDARLRRIIELPVSLDAFQDEPLLNSAGIQPIVRKNGLIVPFGGRIPAENNLYTYMHVRRNQSQYIRMFVEAVQLQAMLFKPYTPGWQEQIMLYLRSFFEKEKQKGAIDQQLTFGQSVVIEQVAGENFGNSANANDIYLSAVKGEVYINISYRPSAIVERIILTVTPDQVLSSGATQ